MPPTAIEPLVGASRPTARCMSVVFPAPFGPTSPTTRPVGIVRSHLSSATTLRYRLVRAEVSSAALICVLLVEVVEREGEEAQHGFAIETSVISGLQPSFERTAQPEMHRLRERLRSAAGHEGPQARTATHESLALEFRVRLQDRVGIDRECSDDLARGGQLIVRLEHPVANRMPNLLHELHVGGHARAGIEMKRDCRYCTGSSAGIPEVLRASTSRVKQARGRMVRRYAPRSGDPRLRHVEDPPRPTDRTEYASEPAALEHAAEVLA